MRRRRHRWPLLLVVAVSGLTCVSSAAARPAYVPSAARHAPTAGAAKRNFCIGIKLFGKRYDGICPVGAATLPMVALNDQMIANRAQLKRVLIRQGVSRATSQRMLRPMRLLSRLGVSQARKRVYDWAKQRAPAVKKYVATCLAFGVTAALLVAAVDVILLPNVPLAPAVEAAATLACANKLADPKIRDFLKKHGLHRE
jgi:hypothetical protein